MRDRWYADNRDLVKWAALLHLSESSKCDAILQVAFYRTDLNRPRLHEDHRSFDFPNVVLAHFRDVDHIKNLAHKSHIQIEVLKEAFNGSRQKYLARISAALKPFGDKQVVVFLDPDTGLAPSLRATAEHVRSDELSQIYSELKPEDWLVLYQHRPRKREWVEHCRRRFAEALDVNVQSVKTFFSFELASDVVLFATQRPAKE